MCYCVQVIPANRIRVLRKSIGLSQAELAKKARTSQQQIQRIEAGVQSARFDLVTRICEALGAPLEQVFPRAAKVLARSRKKIPEKQEHAFETELDGAGIDIDPARWFLKFRLRGSDTRMLSISGPEKMRLLSALDPVDPSRRFLIFDSDDRRIAVNREHLLFCQFLFESGSADMVELDRAEKAEEPEADDLQIQFVDRTEPQCFGVHADEAELSDDDVPERSQELQHMLFMMETPSESHDVFHFDDVDGETVFFRGADVAMLSLPLWAVEPNLWDFADEEDATDAQ